MENVQQTRDDFILNNRSIIGGEIRQYREKKGFSQEQLANLMDISRATISKIENGKFAFSVDYLSKFAWHLNFEISIFEQDQHKQKKSTL